MVNDDIRGWKCDQGGCVGWSCMPFLPRHYRGTFSACKFSYSFFRKFNDILELPNSVITNCIDSLMHRSIFSMINTVFEDGNILCQVLELLDLKGETGRA